MSSKSLAITSYPPPHHVLQDLGLELLPYRPGGDKLNARIHVSAQHLSEQRQLQTGLLATGLDLIAGRLARATVAPDWVATADMALHLLEPISVGVLDVAATVLRHGRGSVVIAIDVSSREGASAAIGTVAYARLPSDGTRQPKIEQPSAQSPAQTPVESPLPMLRSPELEEPDATHLLERIGITGAQTVQTAETGIDHRAELELHDYVTNSLGGLQGGMSALLIDLACEQATAEHFGVVQPIRDLAVRFLNVGRSGPFRAEAKLLRASTSGLLLSAEVIDSGQDPLQVAIGTAQVG